MLLPWVVAAGAFTAAQAANKAMRAALKRCGIFTAAQAANKTISHAIAHGHIFTAAQAANKSSEERPSDEQ